MNNQGSFWPVAIGIVIIIAIGIAIYYATGGGASTPSVSSTASTTALSGAGTEDIEALFDCDGGKSVDATFMNATTSTTTGNSVMLSLSDGRQMTLPQVVSGDGARYANADQSFVFWNVGDTATITENGTTTYDNCVAQGNQ